MDSRSRRRMLEASATSTDDDGGVTKRSSRSNTMGNTIATLAAAAAAAPEAEAPAPAFSRRGVSRLTEPVSRRERSRASAFAVDPAASGVENAASSRQRVGRHQDSSRPRLAPAPASPAPLSGQQRPSMLGGRATRSTEESADGHRLRVGVTAADAVTTTPAPPKSSTESAPAPPGTSPSFSHSPASYTSRGTSVSQQGRGGPKAPLVNGDGESPLASEGTPSFAAAEKERLIVKAATVPRKRRLLRLENGRLVVLPTNVYKQGGGVKLDLALGGFRIDGEKCTHKNRAFNFGVLQGFTEENLFALRAFRNILISPERVGTIHPIAAAEILHRFDEDHLKLPPRKDSEPSVKSHQDDGCWIPDSRQVHVTFMGTTMEISVKAGDLRALDRPLQCKLALDALKNDPKTMEEPPPLEYLETGSTEDGSCGIGMEAGATGFALSQFAAGCSSPSPAPAAFAEAGGADAFKINYPESVSEPAPEVRVNRGTPTRRRKKKKAVKAVDGVVYELPTYVQNVDTKLGRSTLRLKMPLSGFLVNGESVSVADLVVAYGLEVSRKNLLALRACREAMLTNFAGQELVKRAVAAELFHVWVKRGDGRENESAEAEASPSDVHDPVESPQQRANANTPPWSPENPDKGSSRDSTGRRGAKVAAETDDATNGSTAPGVATQGSLGAKSRSALADDVVIRFAGPVSSPGDKRIEVKMMVGELRRTRQNRLAEYRQLLVAMLNDSEVQSGELGVLEPSAHPTPTLTEQNSSGAAEAAAAEAAAAAVASPNDYNGEPSTVPMPPQKQRPHKRSPAEWSVNESTLAHAERGKRPRYERMRVGGGIDVGGGSGASSSSSAEGIEAGAAALLASKRRRQLWMLAIRDNEVRYDRRKEEARREYELRQQQLLRWMVDEEAGRHNESGEVGPPPVVEMDRRTGTCTP